MGKAHRKVQAHFDETLRAAGGRPRSSAVLLAEVIVALAALVAVLFHLASPLDPPEDRHRQSAESPPTGTHPADPRQSIPGRCFQATFFSDAHFSTPIHTRSDCQIAFDWGQGRVPDVPACPADSFSVRWEGLLDVPQSDHYRFYLASDDGSRLYLRDQVVIDNWGAHGPAELASDPIALSAGSAVPIVVEYFELDGIAQVELSWSSSTQEKQPLPGRLVRPARGSQPLSGDDGTPRVDDERFGPSDCFVGRYYAGRAFQRLVHERRDCRLDFDWGVGSATGVPGLEEDDFSVRWEATLQVPATDTYVFYLGSDDGSRLTLDGELLVDGWSEHGFEFAESPQTKLTEGVPYSLVVEFFEARQEATLRLEWSSSTLTRGPLSGRHVTAPAGSPTPQVDP